MLALGACALGVPLVSSGQPAGAKSYRIGFLGTASAPGYVREVEWIREGLRRYGFEEGRNLIVEYRWAEGKPERMREIAAEFVALKVDALVTHNSIGAVALARETATIPIVMADGGDPVVWGLAVSLARPGRNVTGSTSFIGEETAKRLELLKEVLPRTRRVAFLSTAGFPKAAYDTNRKALQETAAPMKVELHDFVVKDPAELPEAFRAMGKAGMDAVVVNNEPVLNAQASVIGALAALTRLPSVGYPSFADAGGLLAYGANRPALYGRVGYFLDRIFKGTKPGDIPFERAAKFDLIVNAKVAQALGVAISAALRLRADRVIE